MFEVFYSLVQQRIEKLIPALVAIRSQYQMRDSQNYENIYSKTSILQKSCFPSSVCSLEQSRAWKKSSAINCSFRFRLYMMTVPVKHLKKKYRIGNR